MNDNNSKNVTTILRTDLNSNPLKKRFYYFMWWCAGSDIQKLEKCHGDYEKHISLGVFILFTGLFASIAMSYALSYVFLGTETSITQSNNTISISSIFIGILWGIFIFFLDRYIVSTMQKNEWYNQIIYALPRFTLAIVISIGISKPLELRIFQDRLNTQRIDDRETFIADIYKQKEIDNHVPELRKEITQKDSLLKYNNALIGKEPPKTDTEFQSLKNEFNVADNKYRKESPSNSSKIYAIQLDINFIRSGQNYKDSFGELTPDGIKLLNKKQADQNKYSNANKTLKGNSDNKLNSLNNYRIAYNKRIGTEIQTLDVALRALEKDKHLLDSLLIKVRIEAEEAAKIGFRPNLAQQIISLENLIKDDEGARKLSWFLFLLFVIIETTPVLQKLLSSRSEYDIEVEKTNNIASIRYEEEINRTKRQINNDEQDEINVNQEVNEIRRQSIIGVNRTLYETIANAQAEIGQIAIRRWKTEQIEKVKNEDLRNYLTDDET